MTPLLAGRFLFLQTGRKPMKCSGLFAAACVVAFAGTTFAEVKVELTKTHVCCPMCVKAIAKVLEDAGVKGEAVQATKSVSFTAPDEAAAQKAIDGLAAAGFHGEIDNKNLKMKDSGAPDGKVTSLTLKGIHNCCGQCNTAIKATVKKVEGVASDDAAAKKNSLTVTGNFDAKALVKALNDAGFHVTAEKK
jgi:copper chaperone CopZ